MYSERDIRTRLKLNKLLKNQNFYPDEPTTDYHPLRKDQYELCECVFVLGTLRSPDCKIEFRIGQLNAEALHNGLCIGLDPNIRNSQLALRPAVARVCFGKSLIYDTREHAVAAADELYPEHCGIKVVHLCCEFPAE